MANKTFTCPKCGNEINIDEEALKAMGNVIVCGECQTTLQADGDYLYVPVEPKETAVAVSSQENGNIETVSSQNSDTFELVDEVENTETPPPFHPTDIEDEDDTTRLYDAALEYLATCNAITIPMLVRYFDITQPEATALMEELEKRGVVGPFTGGPREILIPHNEGISYQGTHRTYETDQMRKELLDQMRQAQENGEGPNVRSCSCSLPSLFIFILLGILLYHLLK